MKMIVPGKSVRASVSMSTEAGSRWLVGSSSSNVFAGSTSMRAKATRLRSPPLRALIGFFWSSPENRKAPAIPRRKFVSACAETSASDSKIVSSGSNDSA